MFLFLLFPRRHERLHLHPQPLISLPLLSLSLPLPLPLLSLPLPLPRSLSLSLRCLEGDISLLREELRELLPERLALQRERGELISLSLSLSVAAVSLLGEREMRLLQLYTQRGNLGK